MAMGERDRRALVLGGGLLLVAAVVRFVLMPGIQVWTDAREAVDTHRQRVETLSQQLDRAEAMRQRLMEKLGPAVGQAPLTVDDARVHFPKAVQDALGRSGAGVTSIELQQVRKLREAPGWSLVSVRVQAVCKGQNIADVLNSMRAARQVILVDRLTLDMAQNGRRDNWKLELMLSTPALTEAGGRS